MLLSVKLAVGGSSKARGNHTNAACSALHKRYSSLLLFFAACGEHGGAGVVLGAPVGSTGTIKPRNALHDPMSVREAGLARKASAGYGAAGAGGGSTATLRPTNLDLNSENLRPSLSSLLRGGC